MVATCVKCGCEFKELSKGQLFLLPPLQNSADLTWRTTKLVDHCYWLCSRCSKEYVLGRKGTELIISKRYQFHTETLQPDD